jgi:hypothetical protein
MYELRNTGALVHYLHKALFSPAKSAMLQAVKDGHLITWPGLTEDAINKHLKLTPATAMGHGPYEPAKPKHKVHLESVIVDQGQLYTDLTGKFRCDPAKETHM